MQTAPRTNELPVLLRNTVVELVRRDRIDLSARQMAVFLICYLENQAHTVRGLAAELSVAKPSITRALDRLEVTGLVRRTTDPMDRRSVLVQRTANGTAFLTELRAIMKDAAGGDLSSDTDPAKSKRDTAAAVRGHRAA